LVLPPEGRVVLPVPAIVGVGATFLLMGLVVSAYGPLLEVLTRRFAVSLPVAGSIISVHFAGGLIGNLLAMRALARRPGRDTFIAGLTIAGAGCLWAAWAPTWVLFLVGIVALGLGFGALVMGLNQLVAYSHGRRRTALLNGLNGAYSAGAVAGPVVVAMFAAQHLPVLLVLAASAAALLIPAASTTSGRLPVSAGSPGRPGRLVGIFVLAFVFYVGIETGAGGWMTSHLQSTGLSYTAAATATSGFFLALVSGRLLSTLIPQSVPESRIVLFGCILATVSLIAATIPPLATAAYIVTGLALAPIFPTGVAWLARLRPGDSRATAWLFPAASFGGVTGPGLMGIVIGAFGVMWAPVVLAGAAVLMTAAFGVARRVAA